MNMKHMTIYCVIVKQESSDMKKKNKTKLISYNANCTLVIGLNVFFIQLVDFVRRHKKLHMKKTA